MLLLKPYWNDDDSQNPDLLSWIVHVLKTIGAIAVFG